MNSRFKHTFLWLLLLMLAACGPTRYTTTPTTTTNVTTVTLADSIWVYSQTHPDGGGWLDKDSGRFYFDSVRVFPEDSLAQASQFGRENAQIAIYILSSGEEIRLDSTQRKGN